MGSFEGSKATAEENSKREYPWDAIMKLGICLLLRFILQVFKLVLHPNIFTYTCSFCKRTQKYLIIIKWSGNSLSVFLTFHLHEQWISAWKVSKYGVISGPYFHVFGLNTGKYGPEITPYLDTFHTVNCIIFIIKIWNIFKEKV